MAISKEQLTINDLSLGMKVRISQLKNIFDTCMLLLNSELLTDGDVEGELVYFGEGETEEYTKWFYTDKEITPVYFDSAELIDGVVYDE